MIKMSSNAPIGSLRRRRGPSADQRLDTPQGSPTTTPNTRKRQRVDYIQLNSISRATTPTPTAPSPRQTPRRQALLAQQVVQCPRTQSPQATRTGRPRPLFDPQGRQPLSRTRQNVIEVADAIGKVSQIAKHK